jgi:hypothetical protein
VIKTSLPEIKYQIWRSIALLFLSILFTGCASLHNPIPEGYVGPTATVSDSFSNKEASKANYFILNKVDQKPIETSWGKTRYDNYGQGRIFTPSMIDHPLLPKAQLLGIKGLIFFPTDAQLLFGDDLAVEGEFLFTPKAGEQYIVKGIISEKESKVWLEDSSGNKVSTVFEKKHDG